MSPHHPGTPATPASKETTARRVVAIAVALLPLVVVWTVPPWRDATALVVLGMMPALAATPIAARSAARAIAPLGAVGLAAVAMTASETGLPALGTALVVALAVWTAWGTSTHSAPARVVILIVAAHLLVDPAGLVPHAASTPILVSAATAATVLAGAGAWMTVATLALPLDCGTPRTPSHPDASYAILLTTAACVLLSMSHAPYWAFSTAVTVAVLALTFSGSEMLGADAERLLCTLSAAGASVAAWLVWGLWVRWTHRAQRHAPV